MRSLSRSRVLGVIIGLLLVGNAAAVASGVGSDPSPGGVATTADPPHPTSPSPTTSPLPGATTDLADLVAELQGFVERERGLTFKAAVDVEVVGDEAFRRKLGEESPDPGEIETLGKVLRALGLLDDTDDLAGVVRELLGDAVAGFYDPETKELYVRGGEITPYVRQVIVHELVHALQDQHFGLDRDDLEDVDDEREVAFSALVEGDAVRVDEAYRASLTPDERRQAIREEQSQAAGIGDEVPVSLIYLLAFPYLEGPAFTRALLEAGDQQRLDAAFARPPTTSEHILHPERFLRNEAALEVQPPAADGRVIDQGVLGEMGLQLVLGPVIGQAAEAAAEGWGGDWYVAWDEGDRTCFRLRIVMDDPRDRNELQEALRRWAARQPDADVTGTSPLVMTSCA